MKGAVSRVELVTVGADREIARLRAALRREGSAYVCEPEKPRLWSQHGGKRWQSMDRDEKAAVRERLRNTKQRSNI